MSNTMFSSSIHGKRNLHVPNNRAQSAMSECRGNVFALLDHGKQRKLAAQVTSIYQTQSDYFTNFTEMRMI
jgi:hypothetical protein